MRNGYQPEAGETPAVPTTGSGVIDDAEFQIKRLDLRCDDILVIKYTKRISRDAAEQIHAVIRIIAPGHRALILEDGMDLAILTPEEIEKRSAPTAAEDAA